MIGLLFDMITWICRHNHYVVIYANINKLIDDKVY